MSRRVDYFKGKTGPLHHYIWIAKDGTQIVHPSNSYITQLSDEDYQGVSITLNLLYDSCPTPNWSEYHVVCEDRKFVVWLSNNKYEIGHWQESYMLGDDTDIVLDHIFAWKPKD